MRIFSRLALFLTGGFLTFGLSHCTTTDDHAEGKGAHSSAGLENNKAWSENSSAPTSAGNGAFSLKVDKVHFDFDHSVIKPSFKDELMEVATYLV